MKKLLIIIFLLLLSGHVTAESIQRFIEKVKLPTGQMVVVAEGDFEAQSVGSFSIRLYEAAANPDETTFFSSGLIHFRDGKIEKVTLADINKDLQPEILVISRSVGTGNYLSVYAFSYSNNELFFNKALEGLEPNADPVEALKKQ